MANGWAEETGTEGLAPCAAAVFLWALGNSAHVVSDLEEGESDNLAREDHCRLIPMPSVGLV